MRVTNIIAIILMGCLSTQVVTIGAAAETIDWSGFESRGRLDTWGLSVEMMGTVMGD
jgi:hypothetical protein